MYKEKCMIENKTKYYLIEIIVLILNCLSNTSTLGTPVKEVATHEHKGTHEEREESPHTKEKSPLPSYPAGRDLHKWESYKGSKFKTLPSGWANHLSKIVPIVEVLTNKFPLLMDWSCGPIHPWWELHLLSPFSTTVMDAKDCTATSTRIFLVLG